MSQQFRTVTTNAGRNAVREALTQGKTVKLSHMSVGDGGGNPVTPLSTMTKLVNERFRAQINDIVLDPATPDLFTAELFIPQAEGGWYIREVGLWMDDGTLFAVGNTPLTEKPDISSGAATDLLVRLIIRVLDAATVSIEIDPAQVLATREYVDRKLDAHNKDGGAHETLARKSVQIKAGTGLTGGGTLEADRTLTVKYGNTAGTACQGNDVRLADARTPKPHKATHQTGGSDAITPADIGAAAKTIQIKPGTGLTGGGTLEADRTLTVSYGTAAGTACQGNDARLSNARTPTAHKTTHKTGGTDALTPADIGAVPTTVQVIAGTGLSGGGSLAANRTLAVTYGTAAGTACQGNDARLSNARTPTAHKATHKTGGTDALTPADIGAVPTTVQVIAGTGLSGGGSLTANRTLTVKYGTGAGTACQGNDARVTASEAFRLSMIGVPRYWRSTTLPAGHVWANGDLALFADWPELKKIYDAGGFAGMLLAYNANSATIAANLGKWRPNAANPTGLYVPNLSEQFFRGWTSGTGRGAGSWQGDAIRELSGRIDLSRMGSAYTSEASPFSGVLQVEKDVFPGLMTPDENSDFWMWGRASFNASRVVPTAEENRPVNIAVPVILYLGLSA
ncbi:phage tail protein [Bilophila wadsworthia]|uniref:phage tail protein n=1 Tax=Bilophila wadsworthia TaxID=35833 RepID=UPI001EDB30B0|nr:phage tail protein [Bilophila wadsworthia]MCG4631839.1 phage tail protein [Bilophila wadsworthia]